MNGIGHLVFWFLTGFGNLKLKLLIKTSNAILCNRGLKFEFKTSKSSMGGIICVTAF